MLIRVRMRCAAADIIASQLPPDRLVLHITKWLKLISFDSSFSHLVICRTSLSWGSWLATHVPDACWPSPCFVSVIIELDS